jgi:hypothetical protein
MEPGVRFRLRAIARLLLLCVATLLASPASAQRLSVDGLLQRIYTEPHPQPFTMTADFRADITLSLATGKFSVRAAGTMVESRTALGEPKRRKAEVTRLDLPLTLRPFSGSIRKIVTDLIEVEPKPGEVLPVHDVFIAEERPDGRYLLGGVRKDIVTQTMRSYNQTAGLEDNDARRAIARWLWSPTQRASIVRPGPGPYMLTALVDENGLSHQLTLAYDWGHVGNRITFVTVGGRAFWREVVSDTTSEVAGFGRVDGHMVMQVTNHCLNCPPR